MNETKKCYSCSEIKELSEFSKNKVKLDGFSSVCKICHSKYRKEHYLKNKDKVIEQVKTYNLLNPEKNKINRTNSYSKKAGRTIEVKCYNCDNRGYQNKVEFDSNKKMYCSKECRKLSGKSVYHYYLKQVETRALKMNKSFDLDEEFIKELLEKKQQNKCNITNISIRVYDVNEVKNLAYSASLDRIDSNLGYTKDNVQWLCLGVNYMKMNYSDDDLHITLKLIKENYTDDRLGVGGVSKTFT